jgi:hypothetical protein
VKTKGSARGDKSHDTSRPSVELLRVLPDERHIDGTEAREPLGVVVNANGG